jgi:hypothetical protein
MPALIADRTKPRSHGNSKGARNTLLARGALQDSLCRMKEREKNRLAAPANATGKRIDLVGKGKAGETVSVRGPKRLLLLAEAGGLDPGLGIAPGDEGAGGGTEDARITEGAFAAFG